MIPALQALSAICWLAVMVFYFGSVWHLYRGTAGWKDVFRALFVFVGFTQIAFVVRWYLFPRAIDHMEETELLVWAGLYLMSSIEAVALVVASFFFERLRGPR